MKLIERHPRATKVSLLVAVLVVMLWDLSAPLHGNFYFRQAHVAANIEKYVARGLSLAPATYNLDIPYALFDFPGYQLIVAGLCRLFGTDPLITSRLFSILCFVATFVLIERLTARCAVPPVHVFWVLFFFCLAPLSLFYFHTPLVDDLALLLSIASLYAFVGWDQSTSASSRYAYAFFMVASGVAATLIKNPVYMPVPVAVVSCIGFRRGWKSLFRPGVVVYVGAVATAVVGFKLYANTVNAVAGFMTKGELSQYFGPLVDRLDVLSWRRILKVLSTQVLNPLTLVAAAWGALAYARESKAPYRSLFLGLTAGALAALLTFFNRYTWHNYYQLPLVFPMAFLAGYGVDRAYGFLASQAVAWVRWSSIPEAFVALVLVVTWLHAGLHYPDLTATPTEGIRSSGEWIRDHSNPGDFVVYLLDTRDVEDWNPVFLYFAKRDGYNLAARRVKPRVLASLYTRYAPAYERFLIFCPAPLHDKLWRRLDALGAELTEAGSVGMLYRLEGPPARTGPPRSEATR